MVYVPDNAGVVEFGQHQGFLVEPRQFRAAPVVQYLESDPGLGFPINGLVNDAHSPRSGFPFEFETFEIVRCICLLGRWVLGGCGSAIVFGSRDRRPPSSARCQGWGSRRCPRECRLSDWISRPPPPLHTTWLSAVLSDSSGWTAWLWVQQKTLLSTPWGRRGLPLSGHAPNCHFHRRRTYGRTCLRQQRSGQPSFAGRGGLRVSNPWGGAALPCSYCPDRYAPFGRVRQRCLFRKGTFLGPRGADDRRNDVRHPPRHLVGWPVGPTRGDAAARRV